LDDLDAELSAYVDDDMESDDVADDMAHDYMEDDVANADVSTCHLLTGQIQVGPKIGQLFHPIDISAHINFFHSPYMSTQLKYISATTHIHFIPTIFFQIVPNPKSQNKTQHFWPKILP
jgi:hypothetical protein